MANSILKGWSGIDVSYHLTDVDWQTAADKGKVLWAAVELTDGASMLYQHGKKNRAAARNAGIVVAETHIARPHPEADPVSDPAAEAAWYEKHCSQEGRPVLSWLETRNSAHNLSLIHI